MTRITAEGGVPPLSGHYPTLTEKRVFITGEPAALAHVWSKHSRAKEPALPLSIADVLQAACLIQESGVFGLSETDRFVRRRLLAHAVVMEGNGVDILPVDMGLHDSALAQ